MPANYNPSDFYIATLAVVATEREKCLEKINVCFSWPGRKQRTIEREIERKRLGECDDG